MAKSYTLAATKHPRMFRLMDREGNWQRYVLVKKFTEAFEKQMGNDIPPTPTFSDLEEAVYLDGVTTILNGGYKKGEFFDKWLGSHSADERAEILKAAGERGDKVHRSIDWILSSAALPTEEKPQGAVMEMSRDMEVMNRETKEEEPLKNDEWDCLLSFGSFWSAHKPIVIKSELPVFNEMFKYAGTADALIILTVACPVKTCRCEDLIGKIGLFDWKTSSGIYASYSAQIASYACATNIEEYLPPGQAVAYTAILRLGTNHKTTGGYQFESFQADDIFDGWQRFLGSKRIFDFETKPFDPETDVIEIPDEIAFEVPMFNMEQALYEAEAAALAQESVKHVKKLKIDLNKLKVGAWIRHNLGGIAEVTALDDDGIVNFTYGEDMGLHHYTLIKEIFDSKEQAEAAGIWKEPKETLENEITPEISSSNDKDILQGQLHSDHIPSNTLASSGGEIIKNSNEEHTRSHGKARRRPEARPRKSGTRSRTDKQVGKA